MYLLYVSTPLKCDQSVGTNREMLRIKGAVSEAPILSDGTCQAGTLEGRAQSATDFVGSVAEITLTRFTDAPHRHEKPFIRYTATNCRIRSWTSKLRKGMSYRLRLYSHVAVDWAIGIGIARSQYMHCGRITQRAPFHSSIGTQGPVLRSVLLSPHTASVVP